MEIDETIHTDRGLIFEKKRQEALKRKFGCKFVRINTSIEGYDQTIKPVEYKDLSVNLKAVN